jgi:hypothetical protein
MNRRSKTPGISRIDQPSHRTHGFFVRVACRGRIHSAFFADQKHGGRKAAFVAAQAHYFKLRKQLAMPRHLARRWNAQIVRRRGRSRIHGVRRVVRGRGKYWVAAWSPKPGVVRKRQFSIRKHGAVNAVVLAIRARRAGLRSMK